MPQARGGTTASEWAGPDSLSSRSSFRVECSMFNPAVENGTKLCNMKPMNCLAAVVYLPNDPSPQVTKYSGPKTFLFSSVLWRVIVQFPAKKGRIVPASSQLMMNPTRRIDGKKQIKQRGKEKDASWYHKSCRSSPSTRRPRITPNRLRPLEN